MLRFRFIKKFVKQPGSLLNDGATFLEAPGRKPPLLLLRIIKVAFNEIVAVAAPDLLHESIPETIPQAVDFLFSLLILRLGPAELHSENHHRARKGAAK